MAINQIEFGGVVLPCKVERFPTIKKAARKYRQYNIPGRSGDVFFQDDAWENVVQSYDVYAGDDTYGSQINWTEMAALLYKDGYQILKDTYDPEHFRKAIFNGPLDVENSWNTHGRATLEFNCRPERFLEAGLNPLSFQAVDNSGIALWEREDFSEFLQIELPSGISRFWVIKIPAGTTSRRVLNMIATGGSMTWAGTSADPRIAQSYIQNSTFIYDIITSQDYSGPTQTDSWLIYQEDYFDETPIVLLGGEPAFGAGKIVNAYMPTVPKIILHCTESVTQETLAARINGGGIYINNASSQSNRLPYYITDANGSWYRSNSEDGYHYPVANMRFEGDLTLKSGTNYIWTSSYFDMKIVPNFWEL